MYESFIDDVPLENQNLHMVESPIPEFSSHLLPTENNSSVSKSNKNFREKLPKDHYRLERSKDNLKFAAVLVLEEYDRKNAREFCFRRKKSNGNSTFRCSYCSKTFLEYEESENNMYWRDRKDNHVPDFNCPAIPLKVLIRKYSRLRNNLPISRGWWKKQSEKYGFQLSLRYDAAQKTRNQE